MRTLVSYIHEHKSQVSIARALSKVLYMSTIRANICGKSRVKCSVEIRTKPGTNKQSPQFSFDLVLGPVELRLSTRCHHV